MKITGIRRPAAAVCSAVLAVGLAGVLAGPAAADTATASGTGHTTAPAGGAVVSPRPAASAQPAGRLVPAQDRQVVFDADGTATYGTLHVPAHEADAVLPAALLIPGSGPTDRNGDQPPARTPHTLELIAGDLGRQGVMTLRYDKYATGETGPGAYAGDPGRVDLDAFVRQAGAAYDELAVQPEADPQRMLIVGHSEGAMIATLVARGAAPAPAGLALLAPQDLRLLDTVQIQLAEQLAAATAQGKTGPIAALGNAAAAAGAVDAFRHGNPVNTDGMAPGIAALFDKVLFSDANARFTRTDDAVVPPAVAADLPRDTSVLITCGTADANVPCLSTAPLAAAILGTPGPGLKVLGGVDHLLHAAGAPPNTQTLDPAVTGALNAFAARWS